MTKNIAILYADSGSGHASVAKAVGAALQAGGADCSVRLVNGSAISPPLFDNFARLYPFLINSARGWYQASYRLADGYSPSRLIELFLKLFWGRAARSYVAAQSVDLYLSCHQITNLLLPGIVHRHSEAKFVSIVTDPFTPHADTFSEQVDVCIVSSQQARQKALAQRLAPEKIRVAGHPTPPNFLANVRRKEETLAGLGLSPEHFTLLISGGGDGLGKISGVVAALDACGLPVQLIIVYGRNRALYEQLRRRDFHVPARLLPFSDDMASLLCAADVLVAKAGPSTIFEAFLAGLPIVLFDAIQGQEAGNVAHVCANGAGFFCSSPAKVAEAVRALVADPTRRAEISARSRALAQPQAAQQVAEICLDLLIAP